MAKCGVKAVFIELCYSATLRDTGIWVGNTM